MNDLISIVVPVYNVGNYLDKCIETIIKQTYKNIEIILVDDGSKDNSGSKCDEWKNKDKRIKVIHKVNGGLSSARNAGIEVAVGKYINFIDSDDYIDLRMIEILYNAIYRNEADISICNRYYVFEDGKKYLRYPNKKNVLEMDSEEAIFELNNYKNFDMSAWAKLYKKELFENIRFPEGKLSEDFYIMYLLFDKAEKIVYNSEPLYYYLQRKGSISKNKKLNFDFVEAAYEQMMYVEKKYPKLKPCVRSAYASANMTVYNMILKSDGKCSKEEIKKMQKKVKDNFEYIFHNKDWDYSKKIQAFLFVKNITIYDKVFKLFRKIKRV